MLPSPDPALLALARALRATGYHHITPTPATHARILARPSRDWATSLTDVFGWSLPFRPNLLPPEILTPLQAVNALDPVPGGHRARLRFSSLAPEPWTQQATHLLFAHSAYPTTAPDAVFFGPDTYRFARAIAANLPPTVRRAVDIGAGAGPGAILIARARPGADTHAVDINPEALRLTRVNAALAGVQVTATESDLLAALPGQFDLIVANPPYLIDPQSRTYRHGGGDWGGGLSLKILATAIDRLEPGGTLLLYTGAAIVAGQDTFRAAAAPLLDRVNLAWHYEEIDPDVFGEELEQGVYAQADRLAAVLLTVKKIK